MPTRHSGISLVQTTDFFYPLVDDPYVQGKIACANVLSDLYAMGVSHCDNMLMLLGVSERLTQKQRQAITPLIIQGFNDLCQEAGSSCNGGQSVINPWFIIGGVATAICSKNDFIQPTQGVAGDVIVLTKPLGTQIAVNAHQWIDQPTWWEKVSDIVTQEQVVKAYDAATVSMASLNRTAAQLMQKYGAHGATDITGFGILGHAQNLAKVQTEEISFKIHSLPILDHMDKVACRAAERGLNFKLREGFSAETSGGLLVLLPKDKATHFCEELLKLDGMPSWVIGEVVKGNRTAEITSDFCVIDVNHHDILSRGTMP